MPDNIDYLYMYHALELANKGAGYVSPNPMVGAVVVKNNTIIGEGYHQEFGQAHAEVNAINAASEPVEGATLYCNLEPCCHRDKKTPPCAQQIIRSGIKRVVICSLDPNPKVHGKGIGLLQESGIEVEVGLLEKDNEELNRFFFKYITKHLPYVTVKIAQTIDGRITRKLRKQTWISSEESRQIVHQWRAVYDAVLVGENTVKIDNCELTVRKVAGRNPQRIVLSDSLDLHEGYKIFRNNTAQRPLVITGKTINEGVIQKFEKMNSDIYHLPGDSKGFIPMRDVLKFLAGKNIASILVEGGQEIFSQFIVNNLTDELKIIISPQIWGEGLSAFDIQRKKLSYRFNLKNVEHIEGDLLLTYR
jgi:diaminohydroxyphosphoribosylaminopyrimidine deaminase/5-amino-6-(5-phosphoribosylamino)uracil reductase